MHGRWLVGKYISPYYIVSRRVRVGGDIESLTVDATGHTPAPLTYALPPGLDAGGGVPGSAPGTALRNSGRRGVGEGYGGGEVFVCPGGRVLHSNVAVVIFAIAVAADALK